MSEHMRLLGRPHIRGDLECTVGWCGGSYPRRCAQPRCFGLVHAALTDVANSNYTLTTMCDQCGAPENYHTDG